MRNRVLANNYYFASGLSLIETSLNGMTSLPETGYYIDVSGYELVHIILKLGTVHDSDTTTYDPYCSDSVSGTLDQIDSSNGLKFTPAITDDGYMAVWTIEVAKLPADHHYISLKLGGTFTNGSMAAVIYMLEPRHLPVTQSTTLLPSAHQFSWVG